MQRSTYALMCSLLLLDHNRRGCVGPNRAPAPKGAKRRLLAAALDAA